MAAGINHFQENGKKKKLPVIEDPHLAWEERKGTERQLQGNLKKGGGLGKNGGWREKRSTLGKENHKYKINKRRFSKRGTPVRPGKKV